jgi:hypothetical protein
MKGGAGSVLDTASVTSSSFTANGGGSTIGSGNVASNLLGIQSPPRTKHVA